MAASTTAADSSSSSSKFHVGADVEVTSPDHNMRGALFPAKIVAVDAADDGRAKYTVEYNRVKTNIYQKVTGRKEVTDVVDVALLRPPPPRGHAAFKFADNVDVFFAGGWWEGVIVEVKDHAPRFVVFFQSVKKKIDFEADDLRIHREWVDGAWVPPILEEEEEEEDEHASSTKEDDKEDKKKNVIGEGTEVEVSNDEEGFEGSWFAATVVKVMGKDRFHIQYNSLKTDDGKEFLKEVVDARHIRPCPPEAVMIDGYSMNEEVEAFWHDGWWEGVICRVLHGGRYKVYFEGTDDNLVFDHCDLRPRQVWMDQTWVLASQAMKR